MTVYTISDIRVCDLGNKIPFMQTTAEKYSDFQIEIGLSPVNMQDILTGKKLASLLGGVTPIGTDTLIKKLYNISTDVYHTESIWNNATGPLMVGVQLTDVDLNAHGITRSSVSMGDTIVTYLTITGNDDSVVRSLYGRVVFLICGYGHVEFTVSPINMPILR